MSSEDVSVGQWIRLRPRLTDSFIYGMITSIRQGAVAVNVVYRDAEHSLLKGGMDVDGVSLAPNEILLFVAKILYDQRTTVIINEIDVDRIILLRSSFRKRCALPVSCCPADDPAATFEGTLEDLSVGGVQLSCERPLATGDHLRLQFTLPNSGYEAEATVEVVRAVPPEQSDDRRMRVGCNFAEITRITSLRVAQFVASGDEDNCGATRRSAA